MSEDISLHLMDIVEELKTLNKQLGVLNESILTKYFYTPIPDGDIEYGRSKARSYLADRIK